MASGEQHTAGAVEDAFSDRLITLVSEHPELYDKTNLLYKDLNVKDNIWIEIAKSVNSTYDLVVNKWKSLRDSYARKLKEQKTSKSGQAAKTCRPYKFQKQMEFLEVHLKNSLTSSNLPMDLVDENKGGSSDDEETGASSTSNTALASEVSVSKKDTPTPGKRRRREDPVSESIMTYLKGKASGIPKERDPDELFLLSLLPSLKRLTEYQKGLAKLKIQQCIFDAEFGQQQPSQSRYPAQFGETSGISSYHGSSQHPYLHSNVHSSTNQDEPISYLSLN